MNKKLNILLVALVGIVVVSLIFWRKDETRISDIQPPKPSVSVEQNESQPPSETLTEDYYKQFKSPATCALSGTVKFLSPSISQNINAYLVYKGVDHDGRLIDWTISPKDDLLIGPNIMAGQTVPDGKVLVGVTLPEQPKVKRYTLTATIQYGRFTDNTIKQFTATCSGSTRVILGY